MFEGLSLRLSGYGPSARPTDYGALPSPGAAAVVRACGARRCGRPGLALDRGRSGALCRIAAVRGDLPFRGHADGSVKWGANAFGRSFSSGSLAAPLQTNPIETGRQVFSKRCRAIRCLQP
jgi:hypothetical protein